MLERWKAALELNGIKYKPNRDHYPESIHVPVGFGHTLAEGITPDANFREAVKNHVFGKNSWFQPKFLLDGTFELMKYHGHVDDPGGLGIKTLGFGTDQNEALLVALESK